MNDIYLYGTVGRGFWDEEAFGASDVAGMLAEVDGDITVHLNSGGGIVHEGTAIYNMLRSHPGHKRIVIEGIAASIASVIAMAGDEIIMGDGAQIMVHDPAMPFTDGRGTQDEHEHIARSLGKAAEQMAKIYARRTGLSEDEAREIMRAEVYMGGDEALEKGFVTALAYDPGTLQQAAAYDYNSYRHAPPALCAIGRRFASKITQTALVAMIAGAPAQQRSLMMADENQTTETDIEEVDAEDQTTAAMEEEDATEEDATDTADVEEDADAEDDEPAATATTLLNMTASFGQPAAVAQHMIHRAMTATQAAAHLATAVQGVNPMSTTTRRGPSRASIQRDERDTMRAGMTAAIAAQMGRARDVDGPARQYMNMSLADMAASVVNDRGPLRSASDKIRVFEAASHSTSDFPAIFENALNKRLLAAYVAQQPTFTAVAERLDFQDFREVPLIRAGDFPSLKPIGENGEIKHGTFGESKKTAVLSSFGVQVSISRQMMINDDLGAIDRVLSSYGQRVALFEDKTFYAFALAASLANGTAVFHADHGNLSATGDRSAVSVAAVDKGMQAMAVQKGLDGDELGVVPSIILTGAKQALAAKQLIAEITPSSAAEVNPFSGDFTHIQTPRITGNEWYLLTAPGTGGGSQWVYGYLDGAEGPRVRMDEPFGRQGMSVSVEADFGVGAQDSRFGYKNIGQA